MSSSLTRQVNTQTTVLDTAHGRILCIADIRGRLSSLNDLARDNNAHAIIHTGDFGFFQADSLERINDRTLRHLTMYSPLIPAAQKSHLLAPENPPNVIRSTVNIQLLSEFPLLLSAQIKLQVPVYTVWGACEDVRVLENFRSGAFAIHNLHVLDEATTRCIDLGGVKLRLLGLGGALVPHKLFDNGDGAATIAGGQGTMWTTALQIGELVDTAQRVYDPSETRLLLSHASPGREGLIAQLALTLKADLTVSAGLHFRYASSYNEFSVQPDFDGFRHKLQSGKLSFDKVWESVKNQVDSVIDSNQRVLLDKALHVTERVPPTNTQQQPTPATGANPAPAATVEEPAWKNCWNWNLCDAAYGSLVLDIKEGRISSELKSQGFNFAYRRSNSTTVPVTPNQGAAVALPPSNNSKLVGTSTPPPASPGGPKVNGSAEKKRKDNNNNKKDKKDNKTGSSTPDIPPSSSTAAAAESIPNATPIPAPAVPTTEPTTTTTNTEDGNIKSPIADGPNATGTGTGTNTGPGNRTPKTNKPPRHPWTIFMRMPSTFQVNEPEIREFFGEAKGAITRVNLPHSFPGKPKLAYVEFGDEEAMRAGLEKHAEKLQDIIPDVKQATDRESRLPPSSSSSHPSPHPNDQTQSGFSSGGGGGGGRGGFGGGRGGRGGRGGGQGGGFANRGLAAAGLTRGGGPGRNMNGGNGNNSGVEGAGGGGGAAAAA